MAGWDPFADPATLAGAPPEEGSTAAKEEEPEHVVGCGEALPAELLAGVPCVRLRTGALMPMVGLGTMLLSDVPGQTKAAIISAIELGYRHFDCARMYQNEKEVGEGFKEAQERGLVKREDLFITTKLLGTMQGSTRIPGAFSQSLKSLNCDYIDLFLIHSPLPGPPYRPPFPELEDTWEGMEKLVDEGKVRAIGVSNFSRQKLERILKVARIKPVVNQVEMHPHLPQRGLADFCKSQNIIITAYGPLGSGGLAEANGHRGDTLMRTPVAVRVAKKLGKTPAQVILRWLLQRGIVAIPKSSRKERQAENLALFDWEIPAAEFQSLNQVEKRERYWTFAKDIVGENSPFASPMDVWDDPEGLPTTESDELGF